MSIWSKICEWLTDNNRAILLYVVDSEGSSPGRIGFSMAINDQHDMVGSIGGGIMEHKLIEWCKEDLLSQEFAPFTKQQIHQTNISENKSGMICSGEQTIAFFPLNNSHLALMEQLSRASFGVIRLDYNGIHFDKDGDQPQKYQYHEGLKWTFTYNIGHLSKMHIIGGGHVGLALSKFASELGFRICIYDDREGLNTMSENSYAETVLVSDYAKINDHIPNGPDDYIVLMSFGYRTDKLILKQLMNREFRYLGMLGSKEKVRKLFEEMESEGVPGEWIDKIHSPIGVKIHSKTPEEIAISILAEIIHIKNS